MNKTYQRPGLQVVKLQQESHLLSSSDGLSIEISGYGKNTKGGFQDDTDNNIQ